MRSDVTIRPAAQVIAKVVGDELVLLDLERGVYYGLNEAGARIWQLLAEGGSIAVVAARMAEEFDVAPEEVERDVLALVEELRERELVVIS